MTTPGSAPTTSSVHAGRAARTVAARRAFPPPVYPGPTAELVEFDSERLRDNPLGDPSRRAVAVLRPPSGRTEGAPLLLLLPGYAGSGPAELLRRGPFEESLFQLFDRLQRSGASAEATLIAPDPTTVLGGNQYVNSSAVGRWDDHLVQELVPWARERFRSGRVGVLGQSSGGFGALHLALEHPGRFDAVGSSAGDLGFEYAYLPDLARAAREFQRHGGPERFLEKVLADPSVVKGPTDASGAALMTLGLAASYSPIDTEPGAFELPFDWETAELRPDVWARWKRLDPVARVATDEGAAALRRARTVVVTGSTDDEWALDQGARWFAAVARRRGVPIVHEEFAGGHFVRGPRFESLFRHLVGALRD